MGEEVAGAIFPEYILRHEDLVTGCGRAEAGCELHGGAEQVVAVLDRLAAIEPYANMDRLGLAAVLML